MSENIVRLILRLAARCAAVGTRSGLACLICMLALADAVAQGTADSHSYPNRTVRIIVPFPPGGPADILTRVLGQRMSEVWGQPAAIENQTSPNTAIATAPPAQLTPATY